MRPSTLRAACMASLLLAPFIAIDAQDLYYLRRMRGYFGIGGGSGSFTYSCNDPACMNADKHSSSFSILVGARLFHPRIRLEGGGFSQGAQGDYNHDDLALFTVGTAVYLVKNLHVRAGMLWAVPTMSDSTGSYTGNGKGFLAGVGYDLHLTGWLALSPYAHVVTATIPAIERNVLGTVSTTAGKVKAMHFGVNLSYIGGLWECVTRAGVKVRVSPKNRYAAQMCLNEVAHSLQGRNP